MVAVTSLAHRHDGVAGLQDGHLTAGRIDGNRITRGYGEPKRARSAAAGHIQDKRVVGLTDHIRDAGQAQGLLRGLGDEDAHDLFDR